MDRKLININFAENVSEKHLDQIINDFYVEFNEDTNNLNTYIFDLSSLKWISNQELLVLSGLFKYLIGAETNFKVYFLNEGSSTNVDKRKAKQIVEIWDVWKIYQIVSHQDYNIYFDIDGNFIDIIREQFKINTSRQEIYERYGVTPFLSLPKIENYDDNSIKKFLNKIYNLSEATNQILKENKCYLPFENKTLSSIITKELYENFLDHFKNSFFNCNDNYAFLSISLKRKLNDSHNKKPKIQSILELNFKKENIKELKPFFFDRAKNEYKNESLLQISFLDFGEGVSDNLINQYYKSENKYSDKQNIDSQVLRYAFEPLSSQHGVQERFSREIITPRGLFDVISIVKRFEGLVVVRSNYGKIAFDFSNNKSIEEAIIFFGDEELYFPGFLISIYIPERNLEKRFNTSSIKPNVNFDDYNFTKAVKKTVRLFDIQTKLKALSSAKKDLYNNLFDILLCELSIEEGDSLIYFDFEGYDIDERVSKKIIYFLCSDYRLNYQNNVIVLNPPPIKFLQSIRDEIYELEEVDRKFKFHPTPFIFFSEETEELEIFWLGVYSENDINKLNNLLFIEHDLRASDFEYPDDIVGHVNRYDDYGNLYSNIDSDEIFNFYLDKKKTSANEEIENLVKNCIQKEKGSIFLCNGNYYQYEYLLFNEILSNEDKLNYLSNILFERLKEKFGALDDVLFAGITASSHKILESFTSRGHLQQDNCFYLNNYFSFEKEKAFAKLITNKRKVILICDVISTGFMVNKFKTHLIENQVELTGVGVLVNAIDKSYDSTILDENEDRLVSTFKYTLEKKKRFEISAELRSKKLKVVRINPFTNTPITHTIKDTNSNESILISNQEFLSLIDSKYIKIGYFEFNNLIHPYFFDMDSILDKSNSSSNELLKLLVQKLSLKTSIRDIDLIFYPKESAIKNIDFEYFKNKIIPNHNIEFVKLERFSTNEGWRFSHPPKSLIEKCKDKSVLIIDDGSCSGESLLQMIDEVAFFDVKKITVLSIVGRVNDHKREFFSRIKSINAGNTKIDIDIFFGCHWHLPTYNLSKSPVIEEMSRIEKLFNFPNTPKGIQKISENILSELRLKDIKGSNNKYLVKGKKGKNINKELILTRDEFGKISEFRFYKEYFDFFDNFISEYESKSKKVRGDDPFKKIELICAVIIHEPYLFESIKKVLPDIVDKIEEFLEALLWKEKKLQLSSLSFDWDFRNILHLLFILYQKEALFKKLSAKNFSILINEFSNSNVDYLLYKLSYYLSIDNQNKDEFYDYSGKIKTLINNLLENETLAVSAIKSIKRFRPFLYSLKSNDSFESKLSEVKHNFNKITDDKYHKDCVTAYFDSFLVKLMELENDYSEINIKAVKSLWEKINPFISDILELSISYPDFFISFGKNIYSSIETDESCLRKVYGKLTDQIYDINENSDFINLREYSNNIYAKYVKTDSYLYKIFSKLTTSNINIIFEEFLSEIPHERIIKVSGVEVLDDRLRIRIPYFIIKEVIFEELKSNFRHADRNSPIYIHWETSINSELLTLVVKNKYKIKNHESSGGGSGIKLFNTLNSYPGQNIHFNYEVNSDYFSQKFKLKID